MANQQFQRWLAWATLALLVMVSHATGQTPGNTQNTDKPPLGFDLSKVPEPDAEKDKPVARVFYEYLYTSSEKEQAAKDVPDPLKMFIWASLRKRFVEHHQLTATEEEIDQYLQVITSGPDSILLEPGINLSKEDAENIKTASKIVKEFAKTQEGREHAKDAIVRWKTDKKLYEQYGGDVIFQQANPLEPVGAYKAFFEEMEKAKVFEIYGDEGRQRFWSDFEWKNSIVYEKDEIDFSRPWWLQPEPLLP